MAAEIIIKCQPVKLDVKNILADDGDVVASRRACPLGSDAPEKLPFVVIDREPVTPSGLRRQSAILRPG